MVPAPAGPAGGRMSGRWPAVAYFFLWRFFLNRFLRLCVAIFFRFRLRPFGIVFPPFTRQRQPRVRGVATVKNARGQPHSPRQDDRRPR